MYQSNSPTKVVIFTIFHQLKHIPPKALVGQWVHPFGLKPTEGFN